jgi:transposase
MVLSVEKRGIKATARSFRTSKNTVRKWHRRWQREGYHGLEELPRRPHHSPNATPATERRKLVELKQTYHRLGAEAIKTIEGLRRSSRTIRKIWREERVSTRARRKKHRTKQNLRAVKREWRLFQQIDEDTKYLNDIPEYYPQMMARGLPRFQYTARDVTSGLLFLGFAQELSLTNTTLFAEYLNRELAACGVDLSHTRRQTDSGAEYIGGIFAKHPSSYTTTVESVTGQAHATIPPAAYTWQADVETVHSLMEREFYEIEHIIDRSDFLAKACSYQLFFNLARPNSYKENKTPWQIVREKEPGLPQSIAMIPPVLIEDLLEIKLENPLRWGHDVSSSPSKCVRPARGAGCSGARPRTIRSSDRSSGGSWKGAASRRIRRKRRSWARPPCASGAIRRRSSRSPYARVSRRGD